MKWYSNDSFEHSDKTHFHCETSNFLSWKTYFVRVRIVYCFFRIFLMFCYCSYIVLDARLLSSCFNCPSSANPRLSLLYFNNGCTVNTLLSVKPGPTGLSLFIVHDNLVGAPIVIWFSNKYSKNNKIKWMKKKKKIISCDSTTKDDVVMREWECL